MRDAGAEGDGGEVFVSCKWGWGQAAGGLRGARHRNRPVAAVQARALEDLPEQPEHQANAREGAGGGGRAGRAALSAPAGSSGGRWGSRRAGQPRRGGVGTHSLNSVSYVSSPSVIPWRFCGERGGGKRSRRVRASQGCRKQRLGGWRCRRARARGVHRRGSRHPDGDDVRVVHEDVVNVADDGLPMVSRGGGWETQ